MARAYAAPGVYREDVFINPQAPLPTGVAGFVGFAGAAAAAPVSLDRPEEFAVRFDAPDMFQGYLEDAVRGFFTNGGARCHVMAVDPSQVTADALIGGLAVLAGIEDLDLIVVPDAMLLPTVADVQRVQREVIKHCDQLQDRFAILDAPGDRVLMQLQQASPGKTLPQLLEAWRRALLLEGDLGKHAALYHPWLRVAAAGGRLLPPCGHVAGIFARSDAARGVFKPPANEEILGVDDFESLVGLELHEQLNPVGINCLRALPGRGLRVYGARTLSSDPQWRYVHVRRLVLTVSRWIERNMVWAPFEPNTPRLWLRIQRELNVYLSKLWQAGGLRGATAGEAFFVKCDAETNPADQREQGRVITQIGLAIAQPAEFVVVRIVHRPGMATAG